MLGTYTHPTQFGWLWLPTLVSPIKGNRGGGGEGGRGGDENEYPSKPGQSVSSEYRMLFCWLRVKERRQFIPSLKMWTTLRLFTKLYLSSLADRCVIRMVILKLYGGLNAQVHSSLCLTLITPAVETAKF